MLTRFANPARFMRASGTVLPFLGVATALTLAAGLFWSLVVAPPDYQQGETVRIMFIHVPVRLDGAVRSTCSSRLRARSRWSGGIRWPRSRVRRRRRSGRRFTLVCLATGSLWGRPMWGAWWVWDARLTSVLVLFFLYLGYIALVNAFDDRSRGARAGALLALVGVVNLPIIKFSVDWWNTLHQPASVVRLGGPSIALSMLLPLLVMAVGVYAAVLLAAAAAHAHRPQSAQDRGAAASCAGDARRHRRGPSGPRRPSGAALRPLSWTACCLTFPTGSPNGVRWADMRRSYGRPMRSRARCSAVSRWHSWRTHRVSEAALERLQLRADRTGGPGR